MTAPIPMYRSAPFTPVRADGDGAGDGLTLEGYAAVFDTFTDIDSWEGSFREKIKRGAFRKSLRERTPVLQFDHGRHPLIGSIPIGRFNALAEDDHGLFISARLTDNWLIQPVREAIRDEAVTGMSFRFEVVRQEWRDNKGKLLKPEEVSDLLWSSGDRGPIERTLVELRVAELGPVVFPAYRETTVGVRAASTAAVFLRDEECRRAARAALVHAQPAPEVEQARLVLDRDVARAVLWPTRTGLTRADDDASSLTDQRGDDLDHEDTGPAGEPAVEAPPVVTAVPAPAVPLPDTSTTSTDDAPPDAGHPSQNDAPPDAGHPSYETDTEARAHFMRRAYVTRERVGMRIL